MLLDWFAVQNRKFRVCDQVILRSFEDSGWNVLDGTIFNKQARHKGIIARGESPRRSWPSVLMIQPLDNPFGVILLASWPNPEGINSYLVQAKEELGMDSESCVVITATVQASYNRLNAEKIPYADLINLSKGLSIPQDPGMFYHKRNEIRLCLLNRPLDVLEGYYPATLPEIREAAQKGHCKRSTTPMLWCSCSSISRPCVSLAFNLTTLFSNAGNKFK